MQEVTAGIDIGGIDTEIGIAGENGTLFKKVTIITTDFPDANEFIKACYKAIIALSANYELKAVGVAAPNGNPYKGTIENPVNLAWKGIIPFVHKMKELIQVPVVLSNDAKAAAVGERVYGAAKGMDNFILITLGAGLGSGIYSHGHLLTGHLGIAGEMGHMIVEEEGRLCNTKRKGCLEAYASVTGIRRTVFSLLSSRADKSVLRQYSFEALNGVHITEAAKIGDAIALEAFDFTARVLGRSLANVASLLDPQAIFVGGGLAKAGDFIIQPTNRYFNQNVFPAFEGKIPIQQSALLFENGGILGACALAWEHLGLVQTE